VEYRVERNSLWRAFSSRMDSQTGYAIGANNLPLFVDRKKHRFAAVVARRRRDCPGVAEETAKEPFFDGAGRGRDGRQSQLVLSIVPFYINPGSVQYCHQFTVGIEDRSTGAAQIRVPCTKMLPAMHENRPFFSYGCADPVRPFDVFRPDTSQPDTPFFELLGLGLISTMVNSDPVAIAKQNDIVFLADDRIKAVDFLSCVDNEVRSRFPRNTQLALRDDVGWGRAPGVDVIVGDTPPPGIEYFLGTTNQFYSTGRRFDFLRVT
jgi:hypothetical protein